jgi:hypothetical protein
MTTPVNPWAEYREAAEAIERTFAGLWKRCYPRRYREIGGTRYDSPKTVARSMMDAILNFYATERVGQTEQSEAMWASMMMRYGVPVYYLSHDIAVALTQTTPAEVLDCMQVKLPFDAAAFMLPVNTLVHKEYGSISFVAYTRNLQGSSVDCPHPNDKASFKLNLKNDIFTIFLRTADGHTLHWTYNNTIRMVDLRNDAELTELQEKYSHSSVLSALSQHFTPDDIEAMVAAIKFIFNTILLMTHKPELVEAARLLKRVKNAPEKPIEYWQPHIIGRTYKLRYEHHEATGATHASPRGHWVSGFWREQPHGPQRSLRKTLWLEPYWRGGKLD